MEGLKARELKARQEEEEDEAVDAYTFVLKKVSSLVEDSSPTQRIVIAGILLVLIRDAKSSGSPS